MHYFRNALLVILIFALVLPSDVYGVPINPLIIQLTILLFFVRISRGNWVLMSRRFLIFLSLVLCLGFAMSPFQFHKSAIVVYVIFLPLNHVIINGKEVTSKESLRLFVYAACVFAVINLLINDISDNGRLNGVGSTSLAGLIILSGYIGATYYLPKVQSLLAKLLLFYVILSFQTRGTILVILLFELSRILSLGKRQVIVLSIFALSFIFLFGDNLAPFFARWDFSEYDDFESFTSGRSITQLKLLSEISSSFNSFLFGNGLNSVKHLVNTMKLEYPHNDVLFLLYEGGLILLAYVLYAFKILLRSFKNKILFWVFVLSSVHTNVILSPGFLTILILLDKKHGK